MKRFEERFIALGYDAPNAVTLVRAIVDCTRVNERSVYRWRSDEPPAWVDILLSLMEALQEAGNPWDPRDWQDEIDEIQALGLRDALMLIAPPSERRPANPWELSQTGFARIISHDTRSVRAWISGRHDTPPWVYVIVALMRRVPMFKWPAPKKKIVRDLRQQAEEVAPARAF